MNAQALTAFEHVAVPVDSAAGLGALSESEADHLCALSEQLPSLCTRGYRSVKLAHYCGLVNLGSRVLEILPKVGERDSADESRGVLLRLLHASRDFPLHHQPSAGQAHRSAPLLEVFIRAFFDEVTRVLKGGLLRRYLEHEDDLLAVRGTVRVQRQFTALANRTDRIACRYDELTADNTWNRVLKAGLRIVRPWVTTHDLLRSWIELMAGFHEATDLPVADVRSLLVDLRYDRQGNRYRPAIAWVERIVSLLSPDLRTGSKAAPGLLFDMNRLFEVAVEQRMQTWAWHRRWIVEAQNSTQYFTHIAGSPRRSAFKVRPDLLFSSRGQTMAVADAKWKRPAISQHGFILPEQADLYQLHAYASVFNCEQLAIIYPWTEGLSIARETTFELPSSVGLTPKVTTLFLDIGDDDLPLRLNTAFGVWVD